MYITEETIQAFENAGMRVVTIVSRFIIDKGKYRNRTRGLSKDSQSKSDGREM